MQLIKPFFKESILYIFKILLDYFPTQLAHCFWMWGIKCSSATRLPLSYLPSLNSPIKTDTFPDPVFLLSPPLLLQMKHQQVARPTHSFLARGKDPSDIKREREGKRRRMQGVRDPSFLPHPYSGSLVCSFFSQASSSMRRDPKVAHRGESETIYLSVLRLLSALYFLAFKPGGATGSIRKIRGCRMKLWTLLERGPCPKGIKKSRQIGSFWCVA